MGVNGGQFRSATFGGFHRQDVLDYLEKLNEEHRQALELQRAELEEAHAAELKERDEEIAELKRQLADLTPQAESWQRIWDTARDITVSAHAQARDTIEDADRRAAEMRAESVRRVMETQERCAALREALHQSVQLAEGELDAAKESFHRAEDDLQGIEAALAELVGSVAESPAEGEAEEPEPSPEKSAAPPKTTSRRKRKEA